MHRIWVESICLPGRRQQQFLRTVKLTDSKQRMVLKELAEEADQGSVWLCLEQATWNGTRILGPVARSRSCPYTATPDLTLLRDQRGEISVMGGSHLTTLQLAHGAAISLKHRYPLSAAHCLFCKAGIGLFIDTGTSVHFSTPRHVFGRDKM